MDNNNEEEQQQISLVDEKGNEELYDVLFTFESDDFGKSYILLYPAGKADDEEVNIEAYALPEGDDPMDPQGGDLQLIETDEEWEMVESVLNTLLDTDDGDDEEE
ncbi:hypothetical protein AKUA1202_06320 [Apilactobacillus kunkeei]|uniref:UPF0473 protein APS55_07370 n=4 Tax=Apilactobacillus TaxID=2767877 RepID=A0A087ENP3_9LACO|nr:MULTISPECIES: DUF1292 domain-containing protein [Lactobacillaceae]MBI0091765.1 DUF1292 domain-containing protein [Lactobacillus sp. M0345]MCL8495142.1 DUF1292 domain-containing protein [Apilactobacillus sp. F1]ALJ32030.1 hypothetical protein APS55_07370 [Apilactobacillus kunkeei]KDB01047.1 hypothetical protein LAKU_8c00200 [Apilactobacillus kunkeei EFB6]KFJ14894.1 hypothetical protein JI66_05745 [Apilactobacillus kunkeei]